MSRAPRTFTPGTLTLRTFEEWKENEENGLLVSKMIGVASVSHLEKRQKYLNAICELREALEEHVEIDCDCGTEIIQGIEGQYTCTLHRALAACDEALGINNKGEV